MLIQYTNISMYNNETKNQSIDIESIVLSESFVWFSHNTAPSSNGRQIYARTVPFQGADGGSIPSGATNFKYQFK